MDGALCLQHLMDKIHCREGKRMVCPVPLHMVVAWQDVARDFPWCLGDAHAAQDRDLVSKSQFCSPEGDALYSHVRQQSSVANPRCLQAGSPAEFRRGLYFDIILKSGLE